MKVSTDACYAWVAHSRIGLDGDFSHNYAVNREEVKRIRVCFSH